MSKRRKLPGGSLGTTRHYDRIWRENMRGALPGIIKKVLEIDVVHSEELAGKLQVTTQKELDVLWKVTDASGEIFALHIEVQTQDDPNMAYRMLEYRVLVEQVHQLPVRQYVIYLGEKASKMPSRIRAPGLAFEYELISLRDLDYRLFLSSDRPEEKLLAILGDFGAEDPTRTLQKILAEVRAVSGGDFADYQYLQQLRILVQLRNLAIEFSKAMETVAKFFRKEKDPFFIEGEKKGELKGKLRGEKKGKEIGELKGKTEVVRNLLRSGRFSISEISDFVNVDEAFVEKIAQEMGLKKS